MKLQILMIAVLSASVTSAAPGDNDFIDEIKGYMAIGKLSGLCGAIKQMIDFQDTTKVDGGDKFVQRFVFAETARLGYSVEEFGEVCKVSVKKYDETLQFLDALKNHNN